MLLPLAGSLNPLAAARTTPFSPAKVSGLVLWLDSRRGLFQDTAGTNPVSADGQSVQRWEDQSGSGNHATQGTALRIPTYTAVAANGQPEVVFDGNDVLSIADAASLSPTNITIYMVVRTTAITTFQIVFTKSAAEYRANFESASRYATNVNNSSNAEISGATTGYKAWRIKYNGTRVAIKAAGLTEATVARAGTIPNTTAALLVGANTTAGAVGLIGALQLLAIYNSEISSANQTLVESWINTNFSVTP